jgi:hypothetical protein
MKHAGGRKRKYSKKLAEKICSLLAQGNPLTKICKLENMPHRYTVMRWLFETSDFQEEFRDMYARARESQAEVLADEIIEIADDSSEDFIFAEGEDKDGNGAKKFINKEYVKRSALRVDARKWVAAKLLPKKYGDLTRHEVTVNKPLVTLNDELEEKESA